MKLLPIALALVTLNVSAECYVRAAITGKAVGKIDATSEVKKLITPYSNGTRKCTMVFKALINGQWHLASGDFVYDGNMAENAACERARTAATEEVIERVYGKKILKEEQMVCEEADTKTKPSVKIGDIVKLGDVAVVTSPPAFGYKGTECRWFVETTTTGTDLYQWKGIVCKVGKPNQDTWQVVDKF